MFCRATCRLIRVLLLPALAVVLLARQTARAGAPHIDLIERSRVDTNQMLIHFAIDKDRKYELQYTTTLQCTTNFTGCGSNAAPTDSWRTIDIVFPERFPNHYVIQHSITNRIGFYRLRVTP
jgi:hypothetical protein